MSRFASPALAPLLALILAPLACRDDPDPDPTGAVAACGSATAEDDAELSAEGEALGMELLGCADQEALIDLFIAGIAGSGEAIDEDCARDKLQDVDIAELVASSEDGDPPSDVIAAIAECADTGG